MTIESLLRTRQATLTSCLIAKSWHEATPRIQAVSRLSKCCPCSKTSGKRLELKTVPRPVVFCYAQGPGLDEVPTFVSCLPYTWGRGSDGVRKTQRKPVDLDPTGAKPCTRQRRKRKHSIRFSFSMLFGFFFFSLPRDLWCGVPQGFFLIRWGVMRLLVDVFQNMRRFFSIHCRTVPEKSHSSTASLGNDSRIHFDTSDDGETSDS